MSARNTNKNVPIWERNVVDGKPRISSRKRITSTDGKWMGEDHL